MTNSNLKLIAEICGFTHKGKVREHNEDSIMICDWCCSDNMRAPHQLQFEIDDSVVCVIADGIGGNALGEFASSFIINYFSKKLPSLNLQSSDELMKFIHEANIALFSEMNLDIENRKGMGTTISGLLLNPKKSFVFNIGDSRVYRMSSGYFQQLTIDDTQPRKVKLPDGRIVVKRSVLTQCLGGSNHVMMIKPHIRELKIMPNEHFILCSDGLSDMLSDQEIQQKLSNDNLETMRNLFTSAMKNGGRDNFSAIVIKIKSMH